MINKLRMLIFLGLLTSGIVFISGCVYQKTTPTPVPTVTLTPTTAVTLTSTPTQTFDGTDFNIIFRYGVGAKNELDTFNGTYTWDMVVDPSITVNLSLSNKEKERIHQKMIENNFFDYPDRFPQRRDRIVTPSMEYFLKVEYDSKIKEVSWDGNSLFEDENIENRLQEITLSILEIIESKDEYKKLPTPRGGYE